ncbi:choice-of-anchor H family protein [Shewanella sp. SR44-3]|uniref:choice-of-anchor H family protein n=1 Tax=Shewanella sp. SR44-3 TaxID=2760936 RepID=UPI002175EB70|nr:choice-of-anchor H family protein [Shewanella sp. SR44-3]
MSMNTFNSNAKTGSNKKVHSSAAFYVATALGLLSSASVHAQAQAVQQSQQELSLERRQFSVSSHSSDVLIQNDRTQDSDAKNISVKGSSVKTSTVQETKLQYSTLSEELKRLHQGAVLNRLWQPSDVKTSINSHKQDLGAGEVDSAGSEALAGGAALAKRSQPEKASADQGVLPMTREQRMTAKSSQNATGALQSSGGFHRFNIYDAQSHLLEDFDGDNFYSTFSVTFDADVNGIGFNEYANVYAELYVSQEGGPWLHYYSTEVFSIAGSTSYDDYRVLTTLQSGYQTAHYDVLIDLYEVGFSEPVASLSSNDVNTLYALPLESRDRDPLYVETYPETYIEVEAGGSLSWWGLVALMCMLMSGRSRPMAR